MSELERCVAFDRRLVERLAERIEPTPHGRALFVDSLPRVWWLNTLDVDQGRRADAAELAAEADAVQRGLDHRKVSIHDELGRAVEEGFRQLGWTVDRTLVMVHCGAVPARDTATVAETDAETLAPVWAEGIRSSPYGREEETVRQLVAAQRLRQRAVSVRYFAAVAEGRIGSYGELFSDGETAQIESLMTLPDLRGRGLASAVLTSALAEAYAAGHDLVFLLADDEDWPKKLYRKLGFEAVGRTWAFIREPD